MSSTRDALLVSLCARRPLALRELGRLMARTEEAIRNAVRPPVAAGRLRYLHPDQPNHPRQKYVAPDSRETVAS